MNINTNKLIKVIDLLSGSTGGMAAESSVFIGTINGNPIKIAVMGINEAIETHDFDGVADRFLCIEE